MTGIFAFGSLLGFGNQSTRLTHLLIIPRVPPVQCVLLRLRPYGEGNLVPLRASVLSSGDIKISLNWKMQIPPSSSVHGISQARILGWVAILLQEIFRTQESNPCLLYWQVDSVPLSHQGSPLESLKALNNQALLPQLCVKSTSWKTEALFGHRGASRTNQ